MHGNVTATPFGALAGGRGIKTSYVVEHGWASFFSKHSPTVSTCHAEKVPATHMGPADTFETNPASYYFCPCLISVLTLCFSLDTSTANGKDCLGAALQDVTATPGFY
jgi:hypothetical protein